MYSVRENVIPIDYACNNHYAVQTFSAQTNKAISDLDARVLRALSNATRGTAAMKLREQVQIDFKNIYSITFQRSVNKLIGYAYITRTKHRRYVYYNITMKGRTALERINQILIDIVNEEMARRNKNK